MKLESCENLKALNEEEAEICNGGSVLTTLVKKFFPPIIVILPGPDDGGYL